LKPFSQTKKFVAKVICQPLVGRMIASIFRNRIPSHRLIIETQSSRICDKTKAELFWGVYESAEARFVHKYISPGMDVLELGSSLGVISCLIRNQLHNDRKLLCVEANPELLPICRRNLEKNTPGKSAFIVNAAIDYSGAPEVWLSFGADSTSSVIGNSGDRSTRSGAYAPAATLSGLLNEHSFEAFALVCDIEGAEFSILANDCEAMRNCRLAIMELHTADHEGRAVRADEMANLFVERCHFRIRDRYGPVFVFEKAN